MASQMVLPANTLHAMDSLLSAVNVVSRKIADLALELVEATKETGVKCRSASQKLYALATAKPHRHKPRREAPNNLLAFERAPAEQGHDHSSTSALRVMKLVRETNPAKNESNTLVAKSEPVKKSLEDTLTDLPLIPPAKITMTSHGQPAIEIAPVEVEIVESGTRENPSEQNGPLPMRSRKQQEREAAEVSLRKAEIAALQQWFCEFGASGLILKSIAPAEPALSEVA